MIIDQVAIDSMINVSKDAYGGDLHKMKKHLEDMANGSEKCGNASNAKSCRDMAKEVGLVIERIKDD